MEICYFQTFSGILFLLSNLRFLHSISSFLSVLPYLRVPIYPLLFYPVQTLARTGVLALHYTRDGIYAMAVGP